MLAEVLEVLAPVPPGPVVDATVGAGGHAAGILEAFDDRRLIGIDQDEDALAEARASLARFGERALLRQARFDRIGKTVRDAGHPRVAGVVFDLGVSSMQLDRPERGFSHSSDGPLDMRMDRGRPVRASDVVNGYPVDELARVLSRHGDERFAMRIARAIVAARPVETTARLAEIVRDAIPAATRRRGGHPARRTFQAIRIEPGGRCVVLAYHSGEDRIVKQRFAEAASGGCRCPAGLPCVCGARPRVRRLWAGARKPSAGEVAANPRSASARLRAVEKLAPDLADDLAPISPTSSPPTSDRLRATRPSNRE